MAAPGPSHSTGRAVLGELARYGLFAALGVLVLCALALAVRQYARPTLAHTDDLTDFAEQIEIPVPAEAPARQAYEREFFYRADYTWSTDAYAFQTRWLLPRFLVDRSSRQANELAVAALTRRTPARGQVEFWRNVLAGLARLDRARMPNVIATFRRFRERSRLSDQATVLAALAFVQSLEYNEPANVLGIAAPIEAVAGRQGDCDTRAVLLVLLLRELGYDAIVLVSAHYRHALVGVAAPAALGTFVELEGRRYYLCETTASTPIGYIDSSIRDLRYWSAIRIL